MYNIIKQNNEVSIMQDGSALISQRKAAELCGVYQNSIVHFFKEKGDISQGLSAEQLSSVVQQYAEKGRSEAIANGWYVSEKTSCSGFDVGAGKSFDK